MALRSRDTTQILTVALDKLLQVIGLEAAEVFVLNNQRNILELVVHRGLFPDAFQELAVCQVGESFPGLAVQSGNPVQCVDIAADSRFGRPAIVRSGFHFFAAIPLKMAKGKKIVGTVDVASTRVRSLGQDELDILMALGTVLAEVIEESRHKLGVP